jgi:selenocysteine lyase/cysteine desulfurase
VIHLNTAGSGLADPSVHRAVVDCLASEAELGAYETEARFARELDDVYDRLARLLGAHRDDIALFSSATDAWSRLVCDVNLPAGSRILVTPYEYAGNLILLQRLAARTGSVLEVLPVLPDGGLDLDGIARSLDERVALVSVVHMPSAVGAVQPVEEIGRLLTGTPALYLVDACQTVGQMDIDVRRIGCHLLTGAGRKFLCGPRGTGFAYVSRELAARVEPRFYDLHVAEAESLHHHRVTDTRATRFETAERSTANVLGLRAALGLALDAGVRGADPQVYGALLAAVRDRPGTRAFTPGPVCAGIVSFVHDTVPPAAIRDRLRTDGINGWVGVGAHTPLYLGAAGVKEFVRLSVHHYNTVAEVEALSRSLAVAL